MTGRYALAGCWWLGWPYAQSASDLPQSFALIPKIWSGEPRQLSLEFRKHSLTSVNCALRPTLILQQSGGLVYQRKNVVTVWTNHSGLSSHG